MSKREGLLMTCDRCGDFEFLPLLGNSELDGGFTRINHFEEPKEKWGNENFGTEATNYMDLCPKCFKEFATIRERFINYDSCHVTERIGL